MEQSIRVSARGEFGQLQRGLHQLQGDLKNVVGEIDKGARKGGFFDDSQVRALDVFSKRFKETLREMDVEFKKQNGVIDEMARRMEKAQGTERDAIRKTIAQREKDLDVLRRQIMATEQLFSAQAKGTGQRQAPERSYSGSTTAPATSPIQEARKVTVSTSEGSGRPAQQKTTDFAALSRALKTLQKDLSNVNKLVDGGARKGGIFDPSQVKALDFLGSRFESTLQGMNEELDAQTSAWEALYEAMKRASGQEEDALQKELNERSRVLEKMHDEIDALEKIFQLRKREAAGFGSSGGSSEDSEGGGGGRGSSASVGATVGRNLLGLGKIALGMAGLSGMLSVAQQAYTLAYSREVNTLNLAQRMRGQAGWSGSNTAMFDKAGDVGRSDRMGYTGTETWAFLDQYTKQAGNIDTDQQEALLKFGRGYGLEANEVASSAASNAVIGGTSNPKQFADAIAGSVSKSGMTPRILEVMQTNNTLLQQMNTTLKDGSSKQILAYQTTLDKIGLDKGMTQLTGAQGANVIGGMGGIFTPGNDNWKWMGIRALQQYKPEKYGKMDLYGLESSFEDGLMNDDNVPAMAQYVKGISGGNEKLTKRIMQKWLTDGGFAATKTEAGDFYDATNGLTAFDEDQMKQMRSGSINSGAKYDAERKGADGQGYLDTDSRMEEALTQIGRPIVDGIMELKEKITEGLESAVAAAEGAGDYTKQIFEFISSHWAEVSAITLAIGALSLATTGKSILTGLGGAAAGAGGAGAAAGLGLGGAIAIGGVAALGAGAYLAKDDPTLRADGASGDAKAPEWSFLDKTIANTIGIPNAVGLPGPTKEDGYKMLDKIDPASTTSKWAGNAAAEAEKERIKKKNMSPDELRKYEQLQGANAVYQRKMEQDPWGTDPVNAALNATSKGIKSGVDFTKKMLSGEKLPLTYPSNSKVPSNEFLDSPFNTIPSLLPATDFGKKDLTTFSKLAGTGTGDSEIGIMPKVFRSNMESFTKDSTTTLGSMSKSTNKFSEDGTESLKSMDKNTAKTNEENALLMKQSTKVTTEAMKSVADEHKGFKSFISGIFQPVTEFFTTAGTAALKSLGISTGTGNSYNNAAGNSGLTASDLNSKLGGALAGKGQQFVTSGLINGVDPALLAAIAMHETGNGTSKAIKERQNVGGMMDPKTGELMTFGSIENGIEAMARNLKKNYLDKGLTSISQIQQKYAPIGASNDANNLNSNWTSGVGKFLDVLGVSNSGRSNKANLGGDVFSNWQNKVTTRFGVKDASHPNAHRGLDIDGEQGDTLKAIAGGTVSFIKNDEYNKTAGGNTIGIKMADGNTYTYAHMSKISKDLKEGQQVSAGDYLGAMGGDVGKAGSGYSTTGSHLHLGYMDKNGTLMNPEQLLNSLNSGDSEIGRMPSTAGATYKSEIEVTLKLDGDGAKTVNKATANQLEYLVRKIIKETERQKVSLSPSKVGYSG